MSRPANPGRALSVYAFVRFYKIANGGRSPSVAEIVAGCELSSKSMAHHYLRALERDGLVVLGHKYRSIALTGERYIPPGIEVYQHVT